MVRADPDGKLQLENIGLNSCVVGDEEVLGGQSAMFAPGTKVRIWPYSLTFEAEKAVSISRDELEAHLRSIMADLELRIHRKLLERLDLYQFEANRGSDPQSILLLENNIEDVCREMKRLQPGERTAAGGDHRPDAPRPPGQPTHHGDGGGRVFRPGRADLQRVRRAGHARAGARGGTARPACSSSASG